MVLRHKITVFCVKYRILTTQTTKMNVFWRVMTCSLVET